MASFTSLIATLGDHAAAEVLRRFSGNERSSAARHRGRVLKQIGDAFMLMFAQPADAIAFGLAMDRFVDAEPRFPALHIGAHSGTVLYREGDYVGGTVNLAPRVASAGAAGQFLSTEDLRDAAGPQPDMDFAALDFAALPPQDSRGFPAPSVFSKSGDASGDPQTAQLTPCAACSSSPATSQPNNLGRNHIHVP